MSTFSIAEHASQLNQLAGDASLDRRIRRRVRILLFSERFQSIPEVAKAADTCIVTVKKWQGRFAALGLAGLMSDAPRTGRPKKVDAALREQILTLGGVASTRTIARKLGVSRSTVHRVLQANPRTAPKDPSSYR